MLIHARGDNIIRGCRFIYYTHVFSSLTGILKQIESRISHNPAYTAIQYKIYFILIYICFPISLLPGRDAIKSGRGASCWPSPTTKAIGENRAILMLKKPYNHKLKSIYGFHMHTFAIPLYGIHPSLLNQFDNM